MRLISSSLISKRQYMLMLIFLTSSFTLLHAQTKTFSGTGHWSSLSNWSPTGVPTSANTVIIASGANLTVDGNYTCDSIYFAAGASGSIITVSNTNKLTATKGILFSNPTANVTQLINLGAGTLACGSLTLPNLSTNRVNRINISTGTLIVNKDFTSAGSTTENIIEFSGAGKFMLGGNWTSASGTFTNGSSSFEYFSNTTQTIRSRTYHKLVLSGAAKVPGGSIICDDSLIINTGATLNNSGSASLTLNHVFYLAGTYIEGSTSGSVTLVGLIHIASTGIFHATVGEAFTIRGGLKNEGNFISGTGNYTFATNDQTLSGNKMITFQGNLTVTGIMLTSEDSVRINGSFTGTGTYVNSTYLLLMGTSFSVTNLDLNNPDNVVEYGRAGTQTIRALTYEGLRISGAATKTAGGNLNINATLYVDASSTLSMSNFMLSTDPSCQISGTGNFTTANVSATPVPIGINWPFTNFSYNSSSSQTIVAGAYINLTSSSIARTLQSSGIIKISGVFTPGTGTYTRAGSTIEFNGSGSQIIPLFTYHNLISSNTGARTLPSGTITVQGNFTGGTNSYIVTGNTMMFPSATQSLSGTFNNLTLNTAGTKTANGNINIAGTLSVSTGVTFDLTTNYTLSGTLTTISNSGTIKTSVPTLVSSLPIPAGKTWNGTIEYSGINQQTIPGGTYNNLTINGGSTKNTADHLIINGTLTLTAGKLDFNNSTLTLGGPIINTISQGLKSGGNGNLILNGNNARTINFDQSIPNTTNRINTLTNNSVAQTTTLGNELLIANAVIPTSGTIHANGNLVLISDSTKTARIGVGTGSYITGDVTVQRYIPESARRWRFVSSPVTHATIEDWRSEIFITGPGTGNTIGTTNSNGFDATASNAPGIYWYNETLTSGDLNTGWTTPTNASQVLAPGRGYRLFIRGDRNDINRITNANPNQNAVTIDVTGPVNKGDITIPVTFTSSGNLTNDGWNLIGNPYPSPFDWKTFHETGRSGNSGTNYTNIEPTIWVLDPVENTYKFYNTLSSEGTISRGILSESQGFWVKATGAGASITFKESFKADDAPTPLFKSTQGGAFKIKLMRDALNADDLLIKYMNGSTKNFDPYDVVKLGAPIVISAWGNDSIYLALSTRPLTIQNDTIKLYVSGSSGLYTMQFTNSDQIAIQDQVLLFDTYTNNVVDLKQNSNYQFNINTNSAATFGFNRFYIVVANNNQLPVKLIGFNAQKTTQKQVALTWATAVEKNSSKFEIQHSTDGYHFNTIGWVDAKGNSHALKTYTYLHTNPNELNYYRLKQIDENLSFEYSTLVKVDFNSEDVELPAAVTMFPIPAIHDVTIALTNKHQIAEISIYNIDGKLIHTQTTHSAIVKLDLANYVSGVYFIRLEDEFGAIITQKFTKD